MSKPLYDRSFSALVAMQRYLMTKVPHRHEVQPDIQSRVVSGLGLIEETLEYLNAIGFKSWRPEPLSPSQQLEELVDILFFYLEMVILSGFTVDEVFDAYNKKWEVNLDRYEKASRGDYSWDKRGGKEGL